MRGRLLAGFVLALASIAAWPAAIPFAQGSPVVIAFNGTGAHSLASQASAAAHSTPAPAPTNNGGPARGAALLIDSRTFLRPQAKEQPPEPTSTPIPLDPTNDATDQPTEQPTDQPTVRPDPTETPQPATPDPTPRPTVRPTDAPTPSPTRTPDPTPKPTALPSPDPTPAPNTYSGTSRFWFPALNIDASWGWYGCDYGGDPTMPGGVWRWGCGPSSNIYLLGHAWSTFKQLRMAYHSGALQVGQTVWYSSSIGDVSQWQVEWIRRVTVEYLNATAGDWALNDSPTPIMTLQTCDGAQSQLRIIVRLAPAN